MANKMDIGEAARVLKLIASKPAPAKAAPAPTIVIEKAETKPLSYRFTIIRDDFGQIREIIMTPISE
jgi:hypothetical protein